VPVPSVVLPSVNVTVPVAVAGVTVAVNVTGEPYADGFADEVSVTVVLARMITFREAEPLTVPPVAVSVVVPAARAFAMPALPAELLIVATEGFDELQMTDCRVWVLLSLNVPVATKGSDCPGMRDELAGATVMDPRPGGVKLLG